MRRLYPLNATTARLVAEVRQAAAAFAHPIAGQAMLQLLTSVGPFIAGCVAMYVVLPISYLLTLALALPTGALLIRVFIVQHDCGHGSFFASRRANALAGRLCSLCTLTPYANWSRQHSVHHADWNNLHRTGGGTDMYSACLTNGSTSSTSRRSCSTSTRTTRRRRRIELLRPDLLPVQCEAIVKPCVLARAFEAFETCRYGSGPAHPVLPTLPAFYFTRVRHHPRGLCALRGGKYGGFQVASLH